MHISCTDGNERERGKSIAMRRLFDSYKRLTNPEAVYIKGERRMRGCNLQSS